MVGEEIMADSEAIIGQGTFIRGNLRGEGDLNVAGRVEGAIDIRGEVVFEETSLIQSEVSADRIVVRGALAGDLRATDSIVLEAGSKVVGDIEAPRIRIDEGAMFRGRIEMGAGGGQGTARKTAQQARPEPAARPAQRPAQRPAPPQRAAAPAPEPRAVRAARPAEPETEAEAPPSPALPKPRLRVSEAQVDEARDDQPPPPVVPALKKKSKGAVRKRGAS